MALTKITPQMFDTSAAGHDFNIDNGTFVVDASANRVGIGTASPSTLLHVDGTATATTFVGALTGNVTGNVSGTAATVTGAAQSAITSVGTLTALTGGTGDLIWDTTTLVVDSSANFVGMGTASPSASLDVVANNNVWTGEFTQSNTSNGDGVIVTVGSTSSSDYALSIRSDAGNTGAFNVKANGNVGIGEFSPLSLLHIKGTGDAIRVESTNTGTGGAQVDLLHFTTSPADNDVHGSINFGGYTSGTSSAYGSAIRSIWTDVSAKESKLSFYTRDDSDFAARMTIDHDGNVAMGTSTVLDGLNIYASSNTNLRLHNGTTGASTSAGGIIQQAGNEMYVWNYEPSNLIFGSNNSERIRIDSSGNVGIGTTAPISQFAVGGNGRRIEIQGTDGVIRGFDRSASWAQIDFEAASYVFDISGSPKVSIDTSGNTHFGKSAFSVSTDGATITGNGEGTFTSTQSAANQESVLFLNRKSTDGDILKLYKDSSHVGSIGTEGGDLTIGNAAVGLKFRDGDQDYIPWNTTSNGVATGVFDLGHVSHRFKDLFLSNSIDISKTTAGSITGGASRAGAVLTLHHEAQWENGYTGGDFLGGIEFSTGDNSAGEGVRAAIKTSVDSYYNTNKLRFYVAQNANTSLLERLELEDNLIFKGRAGTSPRFELVNFDQEDNDTGRETTMRFNGHRSGGEQIVNAQISGHHSGNADDDQGMMIFWTNTGSGGLVETLRIRSDKSASLNDGNLIMSNGYGVHFGASYGSSNTSVVLDDYEEGTWTPADTFQNSTNESNSVLNSSAGRYTKIGNVVTFSCVLDINTPQNLATDNYFVSGLPFASENVTSPHNINYIFTPSMSNVSTDTPLIFFLQPNQTVLFLSNNNGSGNGGSLMTSGANRIIRISGSYRTAS